MRRSRTTTPPPADPTYDLATMNEIDVRKVVPKKMAKGLAVKAFFAATYVSEPETMSLIKDVRYFMQEELTGKRLCVGKKELASRKTTGDEFVNAYWAATSDANIRAFAGARQRYEKDQNYQVGNIVFAA